MSKFIHQAFILLPVTTPSLVVNITCIRVNLIITPLIPYTNFLPYTPLIPYTNFLPITPSPPFISLFERAMATCGLDFRSEKIWDSWINWETGMGNLIGVTNVYDKLIKVPMRQYKMYYDRFISSLSIYIDILTVIVLVVIWFSLFL